VVVAVAASAAALLALAGCRDDNPGAFPPPPSQSAPQAPAAAESPAQYVDVGFETLHPLFLRHKLAQGPKAALWSERYHRRWVRWTGRIRSFSPNGITIKQLPVTSTFDVSLWINNGERAAVRARYKVGDEVTYVGRLDSYDDIWRTIYLVNGSVLGTSAADLGF
jgi:hypothetical protein